MSAWQRLGDVVVLPAWATGLMLEPGAYVVAARDPGLATVTANETA